MLSVTIVGAGIGGLTLANVLERSATRFKVRILESDSGVSARGQGYAIGLYEEHGLRVLGHLDLRAEIERFGRYPEAFQFLNVRGQRLLSLSSPPGSPHRYLSTPRGPLRTTLLKSLRDTEVIWNRRCLGYERSGARTLVKLEDASTIETDIVVACDGVGSAIRAQMIGDARSYLGLSAVSGMTKLSSPAHPLLNDGSFMTLGRGSSLFVMRVDRETALWSFATHSPEGKLKVLSPVALRSWILKQVGSWHEPLPALIDATPDSDLRTHAYYDRDPSRSARDGAVVLLGDAAHPMSPFQGQGANMAMIDAMQLGEALASVGSDNIDKVLARYETEMLARTRGPVLRSRRAARWYHARSAFVCWTRDAWLRMGDWALRRRGDNKEITG